MRSPKQLRYIHLLAVGASVFLGLAILGDLLGVLRHVEAPWMFGGWITLSPSVQESMVVWVAWGACLLISICPSIAALALRKTRPEPIVALVFFIFPLLSLLITLVSRYVGATLLVGSGFLVGYVVTSRSRTSLGIDYSSAQRLVCTVVFGCLALTAAGGVISVLLWQAGAFFALSSSFGRSVTDVLLSVFAVALKAFYLAEPLLTALFLTIALVAIVVLFMEPVRRLAGLFVKLVAKERFTRNDVRVPQYESEIHSWLAYLTLAGAFGLAIAVTVYPILQLHWPGGADFPWYASKLRLIGSLQDVVSFLRGDRGLFLLLLSLTGTAMSVSSAGDVVRFAPAALSVLLALSTFLLVREGTDRLWVSTFAALLSVVSVQTSLGMYAGILANWFALSIVNFTFAMVIRSVRLRSPLAAVGSIVLSLVLLTGYAYAWAVAVVELLLALIGSLTAFRASDSNEWKYDVGILSGVIIGIVLVPLTFASFAAAPLGLPPETLDPSTWLALGWKYAQAAGGETIGSMLSALEFSLADSRMELPFVALLSVLGLLDHAPKTRSFARIIATMVLVPFAIELVPNAASYFPLRGLYMIPLYMLAALGAESVIRRVSEQESSWKIPTGLAFAGAFAAYLFLSQLGYTLMMFGLPLLPLP